MNIPNLPHISEAMTADGKQINPSWYLFFQQLVTEMQNNLSQEGVGIPSQPQANITQLQTSLKTPSIIHNADTNKYLLNENGVYKTIVTS